MVENRTRQSSLYGGGDMDACRHAEGGFEAAAGAENGGCKCGANCTCDPCTCK